MVRRDHLVNASPGKMKHVATIMALLLMLDSAILGNTVLTSCKHEIPHPDLSHRNPAIAGQDLGIF